MNVKGLLFVCWGIMNFFLSPILGAGEGSGRRGKKKKKLRLRRVVRVVNHMKIYPTLPIDNNDSNDSSLYEGPSLSQRRYGSGILSSFNINGYSLSVNFAKTG